MKLLPIEVRNPWARASRSSTSASSPAPEPKPEPPPIGELWRGRSAWIAAADLTSFPIEYALEVAAVVGARTFVAPLGASLLPAWAARARAAGLRVAGWQWGAATTIAEAELEGHRAAAAARELELEGLVLNGEKGYELAGMVAAWIVGAFEAGVPLAWAPEGRQGGDHRLARAAGLALMPEVYSQAGGATWHGGDDSIAAHVARMGWELERVVPLVGVFSPVNGQPLEVPADYPIAGVAGACAYYIDGAMTWLDRVSAAL